jgi:hypothetical protein
MATKTTTGEPSKDAVQFWVETRLRSALDDAGAIAEAMAMFKVAFNAGDSHEDVFRKTIGYFVANALGVELKPDRASKRRHDHAASTKPGPGKE